MKAQLRSQGNESISRPLPLPTTTPSIALVTSLVGDYFEILYEGQAFACLEKSFCKIARPLVDLGVKFQVCLTRDVWEVVRRTWRSYSTAYSTTTFDVEINVYSLRHHADTIGSILLRSGIFLQRPAHTFEHHLNNTYYNPQILDFEGFVGNLDESIVETDETLAPIIVTNTPVRDETRPPTDPSDHVDLILNSLSHASILHEIRTDANRIKTILMK